MWNKANGKQEDEEDFQGDAGNHSRFTQAFRTAIMKKIDAMDMMLGGSPNEENEEKDED